MSNTLSVDSETLCVSTIRDACDGWTLYSYVMMGLIDHLCFSGRLDALRTRPRIHLSMLSSHSKIPAMKSIEHRNLRPVISMILYQCLVFAIYIAILFPHPP
jgi:hypothetical protein